MAKVISPLFSQAARGKVGGLVFNAWRTLATVKQLVSPSQPRTSRQLEIRALMTTYVRAWSALDQSDRDDWNAFAALNLHPDWTGQNVRATGCNWYCALNIRLADMGKSAIDVPPSVAAPGAITSVVATPGSGSVSIAFDAHAGTGDTIDAWLTPVMSPGRIAKLNNARHHVYAPAETTPLVISTLAAGFYTAFLRCVDESTGLASSFVAVSFTVS